MTIIGIDPGDHGAIVFLDGLQILHLEDMPVQVVRKRFQVDIDDLWDVLRTMPARLVVVEKLTVMPAAKGGSAANYKRGGYMFMFRALCHVAGIPLIEIRPQEWQRHFGISGEDTKGQSYMVASRLFPDVELKTPRGRILDGRSDALLIGLYGQSKLTNGDK